MDVKNSSGATVSLLNSCSSDDAPKACLHQLHQLKGRQHSLPFLSQSRRSSSNSVNAHSPHTPALSRSDSDDSHAAQSPSPITPTLSYETEYARHRTNPKTAFSDSHLAYPPRPSLVHQHSGYQQPSTPGYDSSYPVTPATAMGELSLQSGTASQTSFFKSSNYQQQQQQQQQQHHPTSHPPASNPTPKKNSYPCPVARQYGCNEFFTTSGHAARHAKKHTGRKDAICPECSKAFTRKDNMEQHRRTHSGVRGAPRSVASLEDAKAKKLKMQQKKARSPSIASSTAAAVELTMLDPRLMESPYSTQSLPSPRNAPVREPPAYPSPPNHFQQMPASSLGPNRPPLHRASAQDSLQWRLDPAPTSYGSSATPHHHHHHHQQHHSHHRYSSSYSAPSTSLAPALDALALAASRR